MNTSSSKSLREMRFDSSIDQQNKSGLMSQNKSCDYIFIKQLTAFEEEWIIKASITAFEEEWIIKASILRKGSIEIYNNKNGPVEVLKLILCDEEGSKIQATLFKDTIEKFFPMLEKEKTYLLRNGKIRAINPQYSNVNDEIELTLTMKTEIEEIEDFIPYNMSILCCVEFSKISDFVHEGKLLDIVGAVISVKPIFVIRNDERYVAKKREIILINDSLETIKLSLWGDLAENEGQHLEDNVKNITIIAAFGVKASIYEGEVSLSTTKISYILTNPNMDESTKISEMISSVTTENAIGTLLLTSRRMKEAQIVSLNEIVVGTVEESYCSFLGKIKKVQNKNSPWFENCNSCNARVYPVGDKSTAFCRQCNIEDVSYIRRYLLKLIVSDDHTEAVITLFDAAESLAGCSVVEYAKEVLTKKEKSEYYRNLVLIEDKEYKFLVKMDKKGQRDRAQKQIVVQEVHRIVNGEKKIEEIRRLNEEV